MANFLFLWSLVGLSDAARFNIPPTSKLQKPGLGIATARVTELPSMLPSLVSREAVTNYDTCGFFGGNPSKCNPRHRYNN